MQYNEYELKYYSLLSQADTKKREAEAVARECQAIYNTSPLKLSELDIQVIQIDTKLKALILDYYDSRDKHRVIIPKSYLRTDHPTEQEYRVPLELKQTLSRHSRTSTQGYRVSIALLKSVLNNV